MDMKITVEYDHQVSMKFYYYVNKTLNTLTTTPSRG